MGLARICAGGAQQWASLPLTKYSTKTAMPKVTMK